MNDALMFTMFGFLFAGPFILGIAEASVLFWRFQTRVLRSLIAMILVNFVVVALFMLCLRDTGRGFSFFGIQPDLGTLPWFLLGCLMLCLLGVWLLSWPVCYWIMTIKNRGIAARMAAWSAATAFVVFGFGFLRVVELSVLNASLEKSYYSLLPPLKAKLFFIQDGQVMKGALSLGDFSPVKASSPQSQLDLEFSKDGEGSVWLSERGARLDAIEKSSNFRKPETVNDAARLINYQDHSEFRVDPLIAVVTPFLKWMNGRENIFPNGTLITEMGGRIYLYEPVSRKVALVARGIDPLLVIEK